MVYAPMKPPDHPTPSGDRRVARLILRALRLGGHEVELASRVRSWSPQPDPKGLARIRLRAARAAAGIVEAVGDGRRRRPNAFLTYHLYYKAPDLIGPAVADALAIPYLVVEPSHAAKRANDGWAGHHRLAEAALRRADSLLVMTEADMPGIRSIAPAERIVSFPPFLDEGPYAKAAADRPSARRQLCGTDPSPCLLAVGMMRPGDKLASYEALGRALAHLADLPWQLAVVGDGPAREQVEAALPGDRTRHLGRFDEARMPLAYAAADLLVWPAVNEAYGMIFLEAAATGLPAVAGRCGGVADIVENGVTGFLVRPGDDRAFADAVRTLLSDPDRRAAMARACVDRVKQRHSLRRAAALLTDVLHRVTLR